MRRKWIWTPSGFIIAVVAVVLLISSAFLDGKGMGGMAAVCLVLGIGLFAYGLYRTARHITMHNVVQEDYRELLNKLNDSWVDDTEKERIRAFLRGKGVKV